MTSILPIAMVLTCPECGLQHVDRTKPCSVHSECDRAGVCYAAANQQPEKCDRWDNPPHKSHKCEACGCVWRPCDQPTAGVARLTTRGKADTWPKVPA